MGLFSSYLDRYRFWKFRRQRLKSYHRTIESSREEFFKRFSAANPSRLDSHRYSLGWARDWNSLIEFSNPILRERVRSLIRNFPPFQRAVAAHSAFVVGKGARFQSLAVDSKGAPDKELRKRIENGFKNWMEKASTDGRLHFYECQRLALRQRLETGEYFVCFRSPEAKGRHPLALQFIEPDRISGSYEVKPTKADSIVWQGIEFSAETGERFGYHVKKACWPTRFEYGWEVVPEERMLHGFQVLRPGQLRGVTCFAPAIILADSMNDMMISELDAAKMTAKFMGFITTPDPVDFRASRISPKGAADKEDKRLEDLENCAIEYLKPGEKIEFPSSPSRAGDSFDRFTKFVLRMTSIAVGPPFEILSGDYSGINYSTSRMSRQDYNLILEPERFWLEQEFNRPIFKYWLKLESLKNPSDYRGYDKDPLRFELASWIPAGMPSPDPLREGKAVIDMIKMGLMSPQEAILKEGGDPEQVLEELAEFQRLKKEKGVQTYEDSISLALVQNPAKLEQEDV